MEFGNFSDLNFLTFFIVAIISVLALILMSIFFAISVHNDKKVIDQIKFEKTTVRVATIDVQKNQISWFTKSDMKHKITTDLMTFYSSFHPNDVEKVKNWFFSIYTGQETDEYIEADMFLHNGKKPCFSLLKLLKFNHQNGLIHLECHLLKYITPNNAPKGKANNKKVPTGIVKRSQISSLINKNKSLRGYTFGIRFYYIKQQALTNNKIEHHMLMTLKNEIYPYASTTKNPRQILDDGDNELFLFDLRIADKKTAMQLANSISHSLNQQMEVNGFAGHISFCIGIVENGQYYQDFDTIMECCREACMNGQTDEQEIVMHQRNIVALNSANKYEEQINHLFEKDVLRFLFRPIIDVRNGNTIGYFEYVKAYDSPFSNSSEMIKYAYRIGKDLDLFANIAKHILPKFASENHDNDCELFLTISMYNINKVGEIIKEIPSSKNIKLVLILDEQEVNENASDRNLLERVLNDLKSQGFSIALSLKDKDLLLDSSIYTLFDNFIVGTSMLGEIRKNNRIRLSAYTLIESLLKYKKPIIATDLESWQAVELIIESGITYISTDVISPSNDMLLPIEKKKIEKIINMTEKYL